MSGQTSAPTALGVLIEEGDLFDDLLTGSSVSTPSAVLSAEFVACTEQAGQRTITTEFALEWARRPHSGSRNYLSRRLRAVRSFARYLASVTAADTWTTSRGAGAPAAAGYAAAAAVAQR